MHELLLFLPLLFAFGHYDDPCPEFIKCRSSQLPDSCPSGTFYRKHFTVHGCCPGCVSLKDINESCQTSKDCQPGLKCNLKGKCEPDPSQGCEHYKRFDDAWKKTKYWNPACLPDGTFAPRQCKGEKMSGKCFCTDEGGRRIFGEERWSKAENMTCACSRLLNDEVKKRSDVTIHCDRVGNFKPLQCDGNLCWCASPKTGVPYTSVVPATMMPSLPCYNRNLVGDIYLKQCDSTKHVQEKMKSLLKTHGTKEVALTPTSCNFDGTYHRVQVLREKKRCVFINNSPLTEAVESEKANCNCAFDRYVAKLNNAEFIFDCLPHGDYKPKQIQNGKYFCVDEDGFPFSDDC